MKSVFIRRITHFYQLNSFKLYIYRLRDFELPIEIDSDPVQPLTSEAEFALPKLTEMYSVTFAVLPLFKPNGLRYIHM